MKKIYFLRLNEGAVDDKVKKYIRENCASEFLQYLDDSVRDLPDEYKRHLRQMDSRLYDSCIEHNTRLIDYFRIHLMKEFDINRGKGPIKYLRGIARIACEELGFFNYLADISEISLFKQLVLFVFNNPEKLKIQYDSNLNGLSFDEFKRQVNDIRKAFNLKMRSKTGNIGTVDRKYKVVAINSKKEAEKYGKYTTWCVTHGSYDSYAKGGSRFYFCLADRFEDVKEEIGQGCPLDKYGLSMVSVLIDMDGEPTIITTRWNHDYDGENNENFHTVEQFEKVMGIPFYETFKPYTKEELKKMGVVSVEDAKERLSKGENPNDIFDYVDETSDGWSRVRLNDKWNFVNSERRLLSDVWFNNADNFEEGFAAVENKNDEWNFINTDGKIISDVWFIGVRDFHNEFARVYNKNGDWNFINTDGKPISNVWFRFVRDFHEGFASVQNKNYEWNFINTKGELLSDIWFEYLISFKDGFARVQNKNGEWNFINTKGELLSDVWFYYIIGDFGHEGFAIVKNKNNEYKFLDTEGELHDHPPVKESLSEAFFDNETVYANDRISLVQESDTRNIYKTIQKNGIKYYFFNNVVKLFREYIDGNVLNGEVSYALREMGFPFRSTTIEKDGKTRVVGLYKQSAIDELLHNENKRAELRMYINRRRALINDELAKKIKKPTKDNIEYMYKDEDEIYWDIVNQEREEAEKRKKSIDIKNIEPEEYYPEETDMEYVSKLLLNKDIYESELERLSDVETGWKPKEGLFTERDPKKIANYLLRHSKDRGQAMRRLTFYMNRAGENLKNKIVLNKVKKLLKEKEVD